MGQGLRSPHPPHRKMTEAAMRMGPHVPPGLLDRDGEAYELKEDNSDSLT